PTPRTKQKSSSPSSATAQPDPCIWPTCRNARALRISQSAKAEITEASPPHPEKPLRSCCQRAGQSETPAANSGQISPSQLHSRSAATLPAAAPGQPGSSCAPRVKPAAGFSLVTPPLQIKSEQRRHAEQVDVQHRHHAQHGPQRMGRPHTPHRNPHTVSTTICTANPHSIARSISVRMNSSFSCRKYRGIISIIATNGTAVSTESTGSHVFDKYPRSNTTRSAMKSPAVASSVIANSRNERRWKRFSCFQLPYQLMCSVSLPK